MKGISRVPWVRIFVPWLYAKRISEDYEQRISDLCETAAMDTATIRSQDERIAELMRQLKTVNGGPSSAPSSQKPDFVLVGIPRPGIGVRVIASRELAGTMFDMTAYEDPPPRWKIGATMAQALMVDKATYPEAMARIGQIWRNWDEEHGGNFAWGARPGQAATGQPSIQDWAEKQRQQRHPGLVQGVKAELESLEVSEPPREDTTNG